MSQIKEAYKDRTRDLYHVVLSHGTHPDTEIVVTSQEFADGAILAAKIQAEVDAVALAMEMATGTTWNPTTGAAVGVKSIQTQAFERELYAGKRPVVEYIFSNPAPTLVGCAAAREAALVAAGVQTRILMDGSGMLGSYAGALYLQGKVPAPTFANLVLWVKANGVDMAMQDDISASHAIT